MRHRTANFCLASFGAAVSLAVFLDLRSVDLQTGILPGACAALLAVISLGLLIKAFRLPRGAGRPPEYKPWDAVTVLCATCVAVAYVFLIPLLGFYVTTFLAIATQALLLGGARKAGGWWITPVTALAVCTVFYVVFDRIFNVPFPEGIVF
jgi:hypothetical protein